VFTVYEEKNICHHFRQFFVWKIDPISYYYTGQNLKPGGNTEEEDHFKWNRNNIYKTDYNTLYSQILAFKVSNEIFITEFGMVKLHVIG
jgi:hypothetical protein